MDQRFDRVTADTSHALRPEVWCEPAFPGAEDDRLPFTRLVHLLWLATPELHALHPIERPEGRDRFVQWCLFEAARVRTGLLRHFAGQKHRLTAPVRGFPEEGLLPVTELAHAVWRFRPDLQERYDLASAASRAAFMRWYLLTGVREYNLQELLPEAGLAGLCGPDPGVVQDPPLPITRLAHLMWQERGDLQQVFDLHDQGGRAQFLAWYLECGLRESGLHRCPPLVDDAQRAWLGAPAGIPAAVGRPVSRLMYALWRQSPDLQARFDLATPVGQSAYLTWFYVVTVREQALIPLLTTEEIAWCLGPMQVAGGGAGQQPLPRLLALLWGLRPDLQAVMDIRTPAGAATMAAWYAEHGRVECDDLLERLAEAAHGRAAASETVPSPAPRRGRAVEPGVNVIGYARGEFGLGEDARMAAHALAAAGVPVSLVDFSAHVVSRQADGSADALLARAARRRVNLFCLTPFDQARAHMTEGGWHDAGLNIGFWQWELPEWPERVAPFLGLVDELWAPTRFIKAAFERHGRVPVRHMPTAVAAGTSRPYQRAEFGLPEAGYLFLFVFDSFSGLARKNPLAVVEAFRRAFPWGNEPAGLVIKTMNAKADGPFWRALRDAVDQDPRIVVIAETFERDRLLGLIAVTDAMVSLHRGEGFGRTLAEAMLLGKPTIATNFSGNQDFSLPDLACPVGYRMVPVRRGEHPYGEDQFWADPDVEHAAWFMKRLADDPAHGRRLGQAARQHIEEAHGLGAVGRRYRTRLAELGIFQ